MIGEKLQRIGHQPWTHASEPAHAGSTPDPLAFCVDPVGFCLLASEDSLLLKVSAFEFYGARHTDSATQVISFGNSRA